MQRPAWTAPDPQWQERVRAELAQEGLMRTLGVRVRSLSPGEVVLEMTPESRFAQQHGYAHAGAVTALADAACGYAAFSLMPAGSGVVSAEFKVNLLAPAVGRTLVAAARVVRPGRTLTVCLAEVHAEADDGTAKQVAMMVGTMVRVDATTAR